MSARACGIAAIAAAAVMIGLLWHGGVRLPNWVYPAVLLILLGFHVNGVTERVPLYLSNPSTQKAIAELAPSNANARIVDLGCGFGGVVLVCAKARPGACVLGVETAPLSFMIAWLRLKFSGLQNAEIAFRSIWRTDLSDADLVYAFLSPAPMAKLHGKIRAEMKPGSVFVSNSFDVPGEDPDQILELDDRRRTRLLIWRL